MVYVSCKMVYLGPTAQCQSMDCRAGTYNMHDCKADNDVHNHMGDKMQSDCLSPPCVLLVSFVGSHIIISLVSAGTASSVKTLTRLWTNSCKS